MQQESHSGSAGVLFALAAYGMWGVAPAYWKAIDAIPAPELLAHRVLWSFVVGALGLTLTRGWPTLVQLLRSRTRLAPVAASALLIGINWLVFLYAVETDRVLETSLGYYINPLMNVGLGAIFLRERLRRAQWIAVGIATTGVAQLIFARGELPWIAGVLATSFGLYGFVRKTASATPVVGFGVETLLLSPLAILYLLSLDGPAFPIDTPPTNWLVVASGLFTAAPLLCFTSAAHRLRLSTLGMFQYIAPSIAFVLAVALYDEPFTPSHAVTFTCVWLALALYTFDALRSTPRSSR